MTTYNSYAEAKIANPECEIVTETQKCIDEYGLDKEFHPVIANGEFANGYEYFHNKGVSPRINDGYFDLCNPADYCMTVEKFLADGHRFVNGDICRDDGDVVTVKCSADWNEPQPNDGNRYVLRAAALEKEPELTKENSPQGVISRISNRLHNMSCEYQGSDLGEELEGMACEIWGVLPMISNEEPKQEKPRHVNVEYVKVVDSIFNLREEFEKYELYSKADIIFDNCGEDGFVSIHSEIDLAKAIQVDQIYRKVETEIDERQEFIEAACKVVPTTAEEDIKVMGKMFDAGCRFTD